MTAIFGVTMLALATYALTASALSASHSSKQAAHNNRVVAGVEAAISHASWSKNTTPTINSGSGTLGDGSDVSWNWSVLATSPTQIDVLAKATLGDRTIERTSVLKSVRVAGVENFGSDVRYAAGQQLASSYVLAGSEVKATKAGWATMATYLSGKVGIFEGAENPKAHFSGVPTGGTDAYASLAARVNAGNIASTGTPVVLSPTLVKKQIATCSTMAPYWKSSANASKISTAAPICARIVIIDTPTLVTGSGTALIRTEKLVIRNDITTTSSNQLRAWVDGNVEFDLEEAGTDKLISVTDAHIYAGAGSCRTLNITTGFGLQFGGSMACKRIDVVGSFKGTAPRTVSETTYPVWVAKGE